MVVALLAVLKAGGAYLPSTRTTPGPSGVHTGRRRPRVRAEYRARGEAAGAAAGRCALDAPGPRPR